MNQILYSANNEQGERRCGYSKAVSNKQVLTLLKQQGLKNIQLYDDILFGTEREDVILLNEEDKERLAEYEIDTMIKPSFLKFMKYGIKSKGISLLILGGLFLTILGLLFNSYWIIGIGIIVSIAILILLSLNYVVIRDFNEINKAMTYGNWDRAQQILDTFHNYKEDTLPKDVKFLLDTIAAKLLAINHSPETALETVKDKYGFLKSISSLKYQILIADINAINGNYDEYVNSIRKVYELHPDNAIAQLDMALAEAFFGDKMKSENLLNKINIEELPIFGLPIWNQIQGVVLMGEDNVKALEYFNIAFQEIETFIDNPLMLEKAAMIAGYYSIAAYDNQQKEDAKDMLERYWDIIKVHGHKYLLEDIYTRMPYFRDVN